MVRAPGDGFRPVVDVWLSDYLGRHIRFFAITRRNGQEIEVPADPPTWLSQQINARSGERGLRELNGIITAPTLRPDGSLLCTPGYDVATGLLLRGGSWPRIPEHPTEAELKDAFRALWTPFSEFPFVTKEDRGVMLACVLTGIMRRSLPRAPAFSFDAPTSGSARRFSVNAHCGYAVQLQPLYRSAAMKRNCASGYWRRYEKANRVSCSTTSGGNSVRPPSKRF